MDGSSVEINGLRSVITRVVWESMVAMFGRFSLSYEGGDWSSILAPDDFTQYGLLDRIWIS